MLQFLSVRTVGLFPAVDPPGGGSRSFLVVEPVDVLLHLSPGKASRDPEGPCEGSSAERQCEAVRCGVQVRTPSRESPFRIGHQYGTGAVVGGDDSQQLVPGSLPSASHARANHDLGHTHTRRS
jgi:hypothetical protein